MGSSVREDQGDDKLYPKKYYRIVSSHSEMLLSAMDITVAINSDCEIEINITIHVPALLSVCRNNYYEMILIVNFISLFYRCHRRYVRLFYHDICLYFYRRSNTSVILQLYACVYMNAYYNCTHRNMDYIVVFIKIVTMRITTNW